MKTKTITIAFGYRVSGDGPNDPLGYRVERVTDSLDFNPGELITKKQADELCYSKEWKVTVIRIAAT